MKLERVMLRILLIVPLILHAQAVPDVKAYLGLPMKARAQDYDFSGNAGTLEIGVTYMGRSFAAPAKDSSDKQKTTLFDSGTCVTLEVAAFATKSFDGELKIEHFTLEIDKEKFPLPAAAPNLVAGALRMGEDPRARRGVVYGGGMGNADIMVGGPRRQPRFPGDPTPGSAPPVGAATTQEPPYNAWDALVESALPEGPLASGRAGNLFFVYPGKMSKVKRMILHYKGPGGVIALKLR
jgi:hypothetical protein